MDLDPGTVVASRYRISRPLGRGGMGEVFAAENIRTGRPVAIKLLRQDSKGKSSAVARFRQEARAAGSINSDHVTQVLDVEEDAEHGVVLVFELLEGESLIDRLKRTGPIPFDELHPIIEQVWLGLADAHRAGIIHRDLKPSNVFLERRPDGTTRVKILDFGISKVPKEVGGETLTEMGQSLGTFSFMPPEQIGKAKMVDHRADIYACATLIYQSLTGQLPYAARNILVMVEMKSKSDARKLADAMSGPVDPRLEAFVAKGLARDAGGRFQNALDALAAWRELKPGPTSGSQPSQPQPTSAPASPAVYSGGAGGLSGTGTPPGHTPSPGGAAEIARAAIRAGNPARPASMGVSPPAPPAPKIIEASAPLPSVADMTTEESIATIAMPRAQIQKPSGQAGALPKLDPRLDSAAASIGAAAQISVVGARGVGPGGTQLVMVQRGTAAAQQAGDRKARPEDPTADESSGNKLQAHPMGYYIPPSVAASIGRGSASTGTGTGAAASPPAAAAPPTTPASPAPPAAPVAPATAQPAVPRLYDEPSPGQGTEAATAVYRPTGDTARRIQVDPSLEIQPAPSPPKRGMPIWMILFGFLLIGFALVAGAIWLFSRT